MKKSKLLILGLLALMLAGGLVLASCSQKCNGGCNFDMFMGNECDTGTKNCSNRCNGNCGNYGCSNVS
ncbi:hypothetical protein R84B8_01735 [Treponema sp. R8-4-B8]